MSRLLALALLIATMLVVAALPTASDAVIVKTCPAGRTEAVYCGYVLKCRVPRLAGRTRSSARRALTRADCRLGAVRTGTAGTRTGHVYRQSLRAGRLYGKGQRVAITIEGA